MTLLLGITLGLQAQTTLYSWEGGADGATETGGKAESVNGTDNRLNYKNGDNYTMCLNGKKANINDATASANASKMVITLDSELAEGDEIAFTAYINKNESKKASPYILFENGASAEGEIFSDAENIDPAFNGAPATKVTKVPAEAAGSKTITLSRSQSGTNLFITKLVITRAAGGSEEAKPAITFEAPAVERTITIGLGAAGKVSVDWGNGELVEKEAAAAYDGWDNGLEFTGTPSGTVKVYGEGITYFMAFTAPLDAAATNGITKIDLSNAATITELDIHQNNLSSVDLSKLTALQKLTIGVNNLETIDLSANTELTSLDANCTADGKLTTLDLSKNTKLTTLKLKFNKLKSLDLSKNLSLKNIYALNNELTSIDFGENTTAKIYISLNNNKLEKLDVTALTGLSNGTLLLMNNNLTELKHGAIKTLNITGNKFNLATLYETAQDVTTLTAASMQDMEIAETIEGSIDLSAQATIGEKASTIKWFTEDGTELVEGTDYTVADGVFTFIKDQEKKVYATLINTEALPKLTTAIKTTLANVTKATGINDLKAEGGKAAIFNMAGQRVAAPVKGLNIIDGKIVLKRN